MKKYLFIGALAVASVAFAANRNVDFSQAQKSMTVSADKVKVAEANLVSEAKDMQTILEERRIARAKAAEEYAAVDYYFVPEGFYWGLYEGMASYPYGGIVLPYRDSVTFYSWFGPTDWYVNGTARQEASETFVISYGIDGSYYVPETKDHYYYDTEDLVKGTTFGNSATYGGILFSAPAAKSIKGENVTLTLCRMECDTLEDTGDMWMISYPATDDPYMYGTGVHLDSADRATTADTLGIFVQNEQVMRIDQILWPIYNSGTLDERAVIPADAKLHVAIFPVTDEGIDLSEPIATAVMDTSSFVNGGANWGTIGTLSTKFFTEDPIAGRVETPIWIKGSFYVQLTNYNESGCDFGIFADWNNRVTGSVLFQQDGKFIYRPSRARGGETGQNLAVTFDGYFPTIINDTTVNDLNAPVEGGFAHFGEDVEDVYVWLGSNVNYEEWEVEADEWIELGIASTDYWEDYGYLVVTFETEALPDGVDAREGHATIFADGAEIEFTIRQGEGGPTAIENVNFKTNGKSYNVLGVEVGEDYKGVIIRDGQKFIR